MSGFFFTAGRSAAIWYVHSRADIQNWNTILPWKGQTQLSKGCAIRPPLLIHIIFNQLVYLCRQLELISDH